MKRIHGRVTVLAVASTLALAGCGGAGTDDDVADGPITISFWHSASGAAAQVVDEAVASFNEAHEGEITVEATYQGTYDDSITKLANAVQAGNVPDLMQVNDTNTQYMADTGLSVSAQDLNAAAETKLDFENFVPIVASYYTIDGTMQSVPFQVSQPALFINPDLAAEAGLDPSTPPSTSAEVFEWATQINAVTGKGGFVFHINPWWVEELTASAGVVYCTPENGVGGEPAAEFVLTDPAQIAQWEAIQTMYADGVAVNVGTDGNSAQTSFASGDAGLLFASSSVLGNLTSNAAFTPVVAPFPIDSPEGGAVPGGNSVWILGEDASGAREQAAYEFAVYLASDEVQVNSFTASGYLPNTTSAAEAAAADASPSHQALLDQLLGSTDSIAAAGCHSGALQQVRTELRTALEGILTSGDDVTESLSSVEALSTELVASYIERAGN